MPEPECAEPKLLNAFLDYLRDKRGTSPHTVSSYAYDLHSFFDWLAKRGWVAGFPATVNSRALRLYLLFLIHERRLAPTSAARALAAIRTFLQWLVGIGRLRTNPALLLRTPKHHRQPPKFLTQKEITLLLDVVEGTDFAVRRDRAIIETLCRSGLLVSELTALRPADLDLDDGIVRIQGKGLRKRRVPLSPDAVMALREYLPARLEHLFERRRPATEALFINWRGTALAIRSVNRIVIKWCSLAGIDRERAMPRALRHSFAAHLFNRGLNLYKAQNLLGLASSSQTEVYARLLKRQQ